MTTGTEIEMSPMVTDILDNLVKPFFVREREKIFSDIKRIYKEAPLHSADREGWLAGETYNTMGRFQSDYQELYKKIEKKTMHNFLVDGWIHFFIHRTKNDVFDSLIQFRHQTLQVLQTGNGSPVYRFPDINFERMKWDLKNIEMERSDLNETIRNAAFELANTRTGADIKLELNLSDKPVIISHIINFTMETLHELVKNSMRAFEGAGEITISTAIINEESAVLSVSDNGRGIPAGETEKVFLDGYTNRGKGDGQGLRLIKIYVEDILQGTISISSRLHKGTCVSVQLPRQPQPITGGERWKQWNQ